MTRSTPELLWLIISKDFHSVNHVDTGPGQSQREGYSIYDWYVLYYPYRCLGLEYVCQCSQGVLTPWCSVWSECVKLNWSGTPRYITIVMEGRQLGSDASGTFTPRSTYLKQAQSLGCMQINEELISARQPVHCIWSQVPMDKSSAISCCWFFKTGSNAICQQQ